jgi:hypothetical protein
MIDLAARTVARRARTHRCDGGEDVYHAIPLVADRARSPPSRRLPEIAEMPALAMTRSSDAARSGRHKAVRRRGFGDVENARGGVYRVRGIR